MPCRVLLIHAFVVWKEMVTKAKKLRMKVMMMMIIMLEHIIITTTMARAITQHHHLSYMRVIITIHLQFSSINLLWGRFAVLPVLRVKNTKHKP